ncbi:caskin-1-like [Papilio machaon]|uniref:caskin-1-like n=1 Tax=Papilio machaon TaxID=76193 RepID=UPI001E663056|nr:caskin-1-like [Papilio machaon]
MALKEAAERRREEDAAADPLRRRRESATTLDKMEMASFNNSLPQEGTAGNTSGESLPEVTLTSGRPSYSGGAKDCQPTTSAKITDNDANDMDSTTGRVGDDRENDLELVSMSESSDSDSTLEGFPTGRKTSTSTARKKNSGSATRKISLKFPTGIQSKGKKRALKEVEAAGPVTKVSTAARGRTRRPGAHNAYLQEPAAATIEALAARALLNVATIQGEVKKSGNIKGTVLGHINRATKEVIEAVEELRSITPQEEQRRLRAENARLAKEVEIIRAELKAFKEAYSESQNSGALDEMRRELLESVGGMVNARLGDLESRLPPEPVVRPPLQADRLHPPPPRPVARPNLVAGAARTAEAQPAPAPAAKAGPAPRPKRKAKKTGPAAPPLPPPAGGEGSAGKAAKARAGTANPAPQTPGGDETPWTQVVGQKARKKKKKAPAGAPPAAPVHPGRVQRVPPPPKAVKIVAPKTAAITVTLKPGATITNEAGQVSEAKYVDVLAKAKAAICLRDLGLETVKVRTSMTGSKLMEVGGTTPEETADRLAAELVRVIGDWADIARPSKLADLRVSGLDETTTREEVAAKLASTGGCHPDMVKVGLIRPSFWGGGSTLVRCPAAAAKALAQIGKVAIGWCMATVTAVRARPLCCFKCMQLGHTRALCPSEAEDGRLCFRCGQEGHKRAACEAPVNCAVCNRTGCPHAHIMGGAKCTPPHCEGEGPHHRPSPCATSATAAQAAAAA